MNLRRLEYFATVAQTGSLAHAAEIHHVSIPAVSKAIKVLEEELEVLLFIRTKRRLVLSEHGMLLLKKISGLLSDMKNLRNGLSPEIEPPRPIKIGALPVFSTYFLSFLNQLSLNGLSLELYELLPGAIERNLNQGHIDIGITHFPAPEPELDFFKIASIEMGVFIRQGAFSNIAQKELPFVVPVTPLQDFATRVGVLDGWPDDVYRRKVIHRVSLLESALELCRQGRAAIYIPLFIAREHNERVRDQYRLERCASPYPGRTCYLDVYIIKRKSTEETFIIQQLAKAVRLVCSRRTMKR